MRGNVARFLLLAVVLAIVWSFVLARSISLPWFAPWSPQHAVSMTGIDFKPVIGAAAVDGEALGVSAISDDGNALQSTSLDHLHADDFPVLRYRFDGFPDTLELSLVFHRTDTAEDIAVSLPSPGAGITSVDLGSFPEWRGEITELAFAEYAAAQAAPPSIAFKPFRLVSAQLQSRSWRGAPSLLRTAWFGYRPWTLLSISALGPAIESVQTASIQPAIFWGCILSLLATAVILRWTRRELFRNAAIIAALAWAFLDVRWLDDLSAKHRLSTTIYAGKSWSERVRLQPDEETPAIAQIIHAQLDAMSPPRILVATDATFSLLRLIYFLLPLDAAPLDHGALVAGVPLPSGSVVVTYQSAWQFDSASGVLARDDRKIQVEPLFSNAQIGIYRVQGSLR